MKILIDECLPRKFKESLPIHDCKTVPEAGLAGKENGELLSIAENQGFDVFLMIDAGVEYQQNLTGRRIAVLVIRARSNRLSDLLPRAEECVAALRTIKPGQIVRIGN
jgi:predicted nuclease of predicted toxin-antitoxin system